MNLQDLPLIKRIDLDHVVANSFKNFHVKGFDYLCLQRSATETVKLYFFDGDVSKLSEIINPHDHRYDFETWVAAGSSENIWFKRGLDENDGDTFNWFEYRTPLNGGDGFTFVGEEVLKESARRQFKAGDSYFMQYHDLHTIRMVENETVLLLVQFEDRVAIDKPTYTFSKGNAPAIDGLYEKFKADEIVAKLKRFEERTGHVFTSVADRAAA